MRCLSPQSAFKATPRPRRNRLREIPLCRQKLTEDRRYYFRNRYYSPAMGRFTGRDGIRMYYFQIQQYWGFDNTPFVMKDFDGNIARPPRPDESVCDAYPSSGSNCKDQNCNESCPSKRYDDYPVKARFHCKNFVRKFKANPSVVGVAKCLAAAENNKCGSYGKCKERMKCRLNAHVSCYAKNWFTDPFKNPGLYNDRGEFSPHLNFPEGAWQFGFDEVFPPWRQYYSEKLLGRGIACGDLD